MKKLSLRQHYLEQVQRVCRAPALHSQPSRLHKPALVGSPVIEKTLDWTVERVKPPPPKNPVEKLL